ncbi:hypothetical protein ACFH04_07300 [Streptomyces noboritoensis]|uniref:Uncharacterized protein n=1 Tax=Streptomyces noboritoensis TaxID=67337 RepID=A0ABV6TGD3_9ACTN
MESTYLVRLAFGARGPAVEGEWSASGTAQDRHAEWIGLHSANPAAVIRLIAKSGGRERVDRTWTALGETVGAWPTVLETRA